MRFETASVEEAKEWLALVPGLEGVVAKRCDGRYLPGQREWVKVKRQRTADCAVIGIAGDRLQPALVLGLRHPDRQLHHLGRQRVSSVIFSACCPSQHPSRTPVESTSPVAIRCSRDHPVRVWSN